MVYEWIDSLAISYMANWKMAHLVRWFTELKMLIKPCGVGLPEDILGDDSMIRWPIMDFGEIIYQMWINYGLW